MVRGNELGNSIKGTSVLVTGSSGFIGSNLCTRLTDLGCKVIGIDSVQPKLNIESERLLSASNDQMKELFTFNHVDIATNSDVEAIYKDRNIDFIFHLAALANPRTCKANFDLAFNVNIVGTKNIIEKSPKESRLVFMSSAAVYGNPLKVPIPEDHPKNGNDPYALTKIMGEDLCKCMLNNYGYDICIGRNFNTFGKGQIADYIIPTLIKQALKEHSIEIWNSSPVRDFMYIDDTINALIAIAENGKRGEVYNIGTGEGTRIGELAEIVKNIIDKDMDIRDLAKEVIGSHELIADSNSLRKISWRPQIELREGLSRTIEWYKSMNGHM